ncbi:MAG TPA: deaminase [Leptolyngbyaceae cyanobacterium]
MNREDLMRMAIAQAKLGDAPYGAIIVKDREIAIAAHNTVRRDNDPSAHAEMNAIRQLTAKLQTTSLEVIYEGLKTWGETTIGQPPGLGYHCIPPPRIFPSSQIG